MKSKYILFALFFLSIVQFAMAQVTPIEAVIDKKKTTYSTKSHSNYNTLFENQSYNLLQKLQENLKLIDNVNLIFIKGCIQNNASLQNNNTILYVEYIVNQEGNVLSCSLVNYGIRVSFSDSEIECILTEAMNNTFSFSEVPNGINKFYYRIMKRFKFT